MKKPDNQELQANREKDGGKDFSGEIELSRAICLRCRQQKVVDDDGFCESCAKANEQACL